MQKILIIDDDDLIRQLYQEELSRAGFTVESFSSGKECLQALASNHYDLLLLDIMLPDTNGLDILKAVKSDDRTRNILVIMLTNLGQDAIIQEGFKLGAEGYLIKASLTPNQVVQEIKNIVKTKELKSPA